MAGTYRVGAQYDTTTGLRVTVVAVNGNGCPSCVYEDKNKQVIQVDFKENGDSGISGVGNLKRLVCPDPYSGIVV